MEYYSAVKGRKKLEGKWVDLETVILSEVIQTQKEKIS